MRAISVAEAVAMANLRAALAAAPGARQPLSDTDAKDAKRYQWLRAGNYAFDFARSVLNDTPHGIDAAIDAAMQKGV
jgi:hypothetical protein